MLRVSHNNPCPICHKPDACLYAEDGSAAICSRVKEGSIKTVGEGPYSGGYLHIIKEGFKPKPVVKKRPAIINWNTLNKCYTDAFSKILWEGDFPCPPYTMETGWDSEAYTFPVRNAEDEIIGISRRFPDSRKGMVKGSQVGIFIPRLDWDNLKTLFICEGASDLATALDMGLKAIGRLSCQTGGFHIVEWCRRHLPTQVVIISDNDKPGRYGARYLQDAILDDVDINTLVYVPEGNIKDLREYVQKGGTREKFLESINNLLDFNI